MRPMNLNIVDGLIGCFEKSYAAAYGAEECIASGEKRMAFESSEAR